MDIDREAKDAVYANKEILTEDALSMLRTYISAIKFGSVTIKIQDGKIVLIEKNEKIKV